MMQIFDTHTHLNTEPFIGNTEQELALAKEMAVTRHNVVGFDHATIEQALSLAKHYPEIYATIGWHPTEAGSYTQAVEDQIVAHLNEDKVIALGEIGLDYHWMTEPKAVQIAVFKRQIQLAKDHHLPFVVHTRDALADTYQVLKEVGVGPEGGIMHSYSGPLDMAVKLAELGMLISFSGVVTFKKATEVQETAKHLPLDKVLVETDAPYLAPVPMRGRTNRTAYSRYVVEKIAELRGLPDEVVADATYHNAMRVFQLD
ncbi:TatD family hydrolase [Streptococcus halichoeri]|uniref:TatD family hydrolase n=1 Tax=Streptococcus halichoeri TaxID=254785 RepID=UPI00135C0863|nr:TatD family hydrolase [Streptococcus halichoeri]